KVDRLDILVNERHAMLPRGKRREQRQGRRRRNRLCSQGRQRGFQPIHRDFEGRGDENDVCPSVLPRKRSVRQAHGYFGRCLNESATAAAGPEVVMSTSTVRWSAAPIPPLSSVYQIIAGQGVVLTHGVGIAAQG